MKKKECDGIFGDKTILCIVVSGKFAETIEEARTNFEINFKSMIDKYNNYQYKYWRELPKLKSEYDHKSMKTYFGVVSRVTFSEKEFVDCQEIDIRMLRGYL